MKTIKRKAKLKKLKCSVINSCCFSVNLYVVALQKQSGKYVSRVLESSGKVLEFRVSNIVGTLFCVPLCLVATFLPLGSGSYLHPLLGVVHPPIDVNTHPKLSSPFEVCVYCSSGVFVHSVGF